MDLSKELMDNLNTANTGLNIDTREDQFASLMCKGTGFYPDVHTTNLIARMLDSRFVAKGYKLNDCDAFTVYAEIITILTEVAQASNFDKGDNYEC